MKIIAAGDIHGRAVWKLIVNTNTFDKIVFIGDYLDSYDLSGEEQLKNLLDIIEFKKSNPDKVVLLIGNHDLHYFPEIGYTGTSGYQANMAPTFNYILDQNRDLFQMAYKEREYLFTHAGFAPTWIETLKIDGISNDWNLETIADTINDIWKYKPQSFDFRSYNGRSDPYGDDVWQSPVWIRPKSLMKDCQQIKKEIVQIVGHTSQNQIDIEGKSTGGRYYFIDTLEFSGEYLIINDDKITVGKI